LLLLLLLLLALALPALPGGSAVNTYNAAQQGTARNHKNLARKDVCLLAAEHGH
jgi:type II secretory pathway component PulJ